MLPTSLIRHPLQFFIGGAWVEPATDARIIVTSPSTEETFIEVAEAATPDIDRAVAAARAAFDQGPWPRMSHAERGAFLRAMGDEVEARIPTLSTIWTHEIGVATIWSSALSAPTAETYRYYGKLAEEFPFVERRTPSDGRGVGLLVREPVGVVGAIVPWNGALGLIAFKIAPALLAGCTVILKSSPESPGAGLVMAEIAEKIGLPPGVLNVVTADREVSEALVRHPDVDKITFTGSSAAGKRIAEICGGRMARCTLELGGKSAAVILDDSDLGQVAQQLSMTATLMSGQVCAALTRVVVPRHRHDALVDAMSAAYAAIKMGDPFDPVTEMGPLAMERQRDRVEGYIAKGQAEGATLATGGGRPAHLNRGFFIEPTVFANVDNGMTIAREEIFGPVISVIPADDEAQAVEIANDSPFGLNAAVFTNDIERAYAVSRRLRSGTVGHNAFRLDFGIAFGGFKQSGIGREGGVEGLLPFLETKTLLLDAAPSGV
jgi:aldehyde dehydrogenase (NAD+)